MEEWKQYRLIDVLDTLIDYRGKTPKKTTSGIPLITAKIIKNGRIETPTEFISVDDYDSWMVRGFPKVGDVVLTTEAPLGEVAQLKNDNVALAQRVVTLRGKAGVLNNTYLKYYLFSNVGQQRLKARETGTTVTGIKQSELREVLINIPSYEIQNDIASILSSLDDKIEVNRRINENLEAQAQALFKSWFVDFEPFKDGEFVESELGMIPKGWKVGKLSDIAYITMGTSPAGSSYNITGKGEVFYQGRAEFGFRFPRRNMYTTEAKKYAEIDSVLLSVRAPVGDINVAEEKCCIGRGLSSIQSKEGNNSFVLYLMQNLKPEFEKYNGEGTVFGSINKKALEDIKILIPQHEVLKRFEQIGKEIDGQIKTLDIESRRLASLRDTLLPRLMSGEISLE